jgi:hypothetical protein
MLYSVSHTSSPFYGLKCDLFWTKFHELLRRMCIQHLLDGIFCVCLWYSLSAVQFNSEISLLIFCLDDLSIYGVGILKSSIMILSGSVYSFMYSSVCFMKLGTSTFVVYIYNCYIFLMDCSEYVVILFISSH